MASRNRSTAKAKSSVRIEPASAGEPRPGPTTPSQKEVDAAVEKSAEFLEQQAEPPEAHVKPTTPTKAEVEAAVSQSAEYLQEQGVAVDTSTHASSGRDKTMDAAPVSAGGMNSTLAASPVSGARDKTMDASPVFSAPVPDAPRD